MRRVVFTVAALILGITLSAFASSNSRDIRPLCEKAGIGGEDLKKLTFVYREAVKTGIPEEELYSFFEEIVNYGLSCSQLKSVLDRTLRLRKENLPYGPVFSKVREGMAKGMSPGMIVEVAGERAGSIEKAADVVKTLLSRGWEVKDFEGAVLLISTYIEKGYEPDEIVERLGSKGIKYAGFAGLDAFLGQGK